MRWTQKQLDDYLARQQQDKTSPIKPSAASRHETARAREVPYRPSSVKPAPTIGWQGKQTKTEAKYNQEILRGAGRFEAITLVLPGGGRYTPDFLTINDGVVTLHEVKGSYRLGSEGRAHTAFFEASAAFPFFRFVWAKWSGKDWSVKTLEPSVMIGGPQDG